MEQETVAESIRALSSRFLAGECARRGIRVEHLNPFNKGDAFLGLKYGEHVEYALGTKSSLTTSSASIACENKALTKVFLAERGLSFPAGRLLLRADAPAVEQYAAELGFPCVLKKNNGSLGKMVFIGVRDLNACRQLLEGPLQQEKYVLVEEERHGKEYRFFATRDKVLGVTHREPANVTGDGHSTLGELAEKKDESKLPKYRIKLDELAMAYLGDRGLNLSSVPAAGEKVYLRPNSNASTGGDTVDFTDEAHAGLKEIAVEAVRSVPGLAYGGVDILTEGPVTEAPTAQSYAILEINSNPDIFIHHSPYQGQARDIASGIVDLLFPETKE